MGFRGARAPWRAIFGASPKCFSIQPKKDVGEAPTTAREARALPRIVRAARGETPASCRRQQASSLRSPETN
jgi:hypothetical protein